jgi:hypothetical protein
VWTDTQTQRLSPISRDARVGTVADLSQRILMLPLFISNNCLSHSTTRLRLLKISFL